MTCFARRFISVSSEGFQWFEVTLSGGQGTQRGAIAWADVRGAARVGDWNGCAAARFAPRGCRVLTLAGRLFGAEMQHPGVEKDVTVLWCKSAAERDVGALSSRLLQIICSLCCCRTCWLPSTASAGANKRSAQKPRVSQVCCVPSASVRVASIVNRPDLAGKVAWNTCALLNPQDRAAIDAKTCVGCL